MHPPAAPKVLFSSLDEGPRFPSTLSTHDQTGGLGSFRAIPGHNGGSTQKAQGACSFWGFPCQTHSFAKPRVTWSFALLSYTPVYHLSGTVLGGSPISVFIWGGHQVPSTPSA